MCLLYGILSYLLEDMQTIEKIQEGLSNLFHLSSNFPTMKDVQPEFTKFTVSLT